MMLNATARELATVKAGTISHECAEKGNRGYRNVDVMIGKVKVNLEEFTQGNREEVYLSVTAGDLEIGERIKAADLPLLIEALILARAKAEATGFI